MIICAGTRDGDRPGHDMSAFGGEGDVIQRYYLYVAGQ
jgi:hypothetical protein